MKARLMVLPNALRGGAWPSSARAVRCSVKSENERDPRSYLQSVSPEAEHNKKTARYKWEEGVGNDRSACPESSGLHASYNGRHNELRPREGELISKADPSTDRGLQLTLVKLESLVIATHYIAVNTSLLLAHTVRHSNQAGSR